MSRDITERLRDPVARAAWANAEMFEEAADEIERLREANHRAYLAINAICDRLGDVRDEMFALERGRDD